MPRKQAVELSVIQREREFPGVTRQSSTFGELESNLDMAPANTNTDGYARHRRTRLKFYSSCIPCTAVLLLIFIILMAVSVIKLEYYEMGFLKTKSTGSVDRDTVYSGGSYMRGPDSTFIVFPKSAVFSELNDLSVWTASSDTDAGTSAYLDIKFQFLLQQDKLSDIYEATNMGFESYITNIAIDSLKNAATLFSADQYLEDRRTVEMRFKQEVTDVLNGVHVTVLGLQLHRVEFPYEFYSNKLNAAIQNEKNDEEMYRKQATVTRGSTTRDVKFVENDALLVHKRSESEAELIRANATHASTRIFEQVRNDAIRDFCDQLGFVDTQHILSVDMFFRLLDQRQNNVVVGIDRPDALLSL